MSNINSPQVIAQPTPFLPVPKVPRNPNPDAALVAAVAGDEAAAPLTRLEAVIVEAEEAVRDLEACDQEAPEASSTGPAGATRSPPTPTTPPAGDRPTKTWRTQALLQGEPRRWADASALARAVGVLLKQASEIWTGTESRARLGLGRLRVAPVR